MSRGFEEHPVRAPPSAENRQKIARIRIFKALVARSLYTSYRGQPLISSFGTSHPGGPPGADRPGLAGRARRSIQADDFDAAVGLAAAGGAIGGHGPGLPVTHGFHAPGLHALDGQV